MSKIGLWSTTPSSNNSTPPDGWPEGQAPSTVNDCAREMMAQIRVMANDLQYIDLGHTPSFLTSTTFSLGAADTTNFEVGRRLKLFDATTLYGTIDSVSGTFVSVRLDSGALTSSLSSVALGVLRNTRGALPEAAHSQRNLVINGDMTVWQRGTSFGDVANSQYTADRFMHEKGDMTGSGYVVQKRGSASASAVPTVVQAGRYIENSLAYVVSATQSALLASSYAMLSYVVEGFDWKTVAHQKMGLGFWVSSNKSGIYSVAIRSGPASASYVAAFTLTAVNTMTRFFLSIPEAPSTPYTWNYTSGAGLRISWILAAGTSYQVGTTNEWTAANLLASPSQTNLFEGQNEFIVTGVVLKRGWADVPLVTPPYAEELHNCQRYYWRGLPCTALNGPAYTVGAVLSWACNLPVTMRASPTMNVSAPGATYLSLTNLGADAASPNGFRLLAFSTQQDNNANVLFNTGSDYFEASAEIT